jgi:hypothetical protein
MKLIETKTLGTAAASIEFTSIPQTFTDLLVICSLRASNAVFARNITFFVNGVEQSGARVLRATGSLTRSDTTVPLINGAVGSSATANTFSSNQIYFPEYSGTSRKKTYSVDTVTENNAIEAHQVIAAGLYDSTNAITSLTFTNTGNTILADSTISLYGITKGSDGITTAS